MKKNLAFILPLGLIVAIFVWGAKQQAERMNTDMGSTDQSAYMNFAKRMAQTQFLYTGGRNRMPLYPGLMSLFYKEGMSDEEFFERGKRIGIAIGLFGSTVAFLVLRRVSKPVDALTGTLITMFTVLVYKSPYFQAEVLFYTINFLLFYLLLSLVRQPGVRLAALAGLMGGIGHLTKASVLPALLLAALLVLVRGAVDLWRRHRNANTPVIQASRSRFVLKHLCSVTILLGCFLFVIFPYILQSKSHYGHYFYNVNSTFYIWYDSWAEAKQGTRAQGDRIGWPHMPAEQIPSFTKYVREHSLNEILGRFTRGFRNLWNTVTRSYGYAEFLLMYAIALVLLMVQNKVLCFGMFRYVHPSVILFVLVYFFGYTCLYAWYTPIAEGNRLVLSIFLPAVLMFVCALSYAQDHSLCYSCFGRKISASSVSPAVLLFLSAYMIIGFPHRISTMYGGG